MATDPLFANTLLFVLIFGSIALFAVGWIGFWIYFVWQAHRREMRNDYALSHEEYWQQLEDFHKRNGTWVGSESDDPPDTSEEIGPTLSKSVESSEKGPHRRPERS
ncbi:MAG: hypothetical protein AAF525_18965 [Pseudomonadota bacterium]